MTLHATKTWGVENFLHTDFNNYLRDNMDAFHTVVEGAQGFSDTGLTINTSPTIVASHLTLYSATPSDNTRILIVLSLRTTIASGSPTLLSIGVQDQASVQVRFVTHSITTGNAQNFLIVAQSLVASTTNPGFKVQAFVNTGTLSASIGSLVFPSFR